VKMSLPFESNIENDGIVIYEAASKGVLVEVRTDKDTVWLNRQQLATLFARDVKTIGKHINNALREELTGIPVVAKFATTALDGKTYQVEHYNLDMILSVGFRVKSSEGIHFRRWANTILQQHLINGYTINQNRLEHLNKVIEVIARSEVPEIAGIASVLDVYSNGLNLLDGYDHQALQHPKGDAAQWKLAYDEARAFVDSMMFSESSTLFGQEKDDSFHSALGAIYQTFGGDEVYPSVQEKAANLLYFIVKNHSFVDGNKRIAAALFVYFLDKNDALKKANGELLISNNALAATTLMIALSRPEEKETMCLLVMNMLNDTEDI
jgi:prophage maintenance system killer protein